MFAKHVDYPFYLFAVLALRNRATNTGAPYSQRLARAWHLHILITAKRGHGSVHAGQPILRGGDGEFTLVNLDAQMPGVAQQGLPINQPGIVKPRPILRATPLHECLSAITVCFDGPVMPTAKQIFQCLWPGIAQLPTVAKITSISSSHQCHDRTYPIHDPHLPQSRDQVYRGISGEQFHGSSAS
ncbi:hypothetical protein PS627_04473 [Pseudomonas fluorescens]|nr:hypothetical protein PS627_04473 [Pseudomonas fluorescens]